MRTLHGQSACGAAAAVAAVLVVAGCSTSPTSVTDPTASTSPPPATVSTPAPTGSASPDPTSSLDAVVLAAYDGFWRAQVATLNNPRKKPDPGLKRYAIDKALAGVGESWLIYRHNGVENRGKPTLAPKITSWSSGAEPAATITDCVDSTNWQPVYVKTGKPAAAPGQSPRIIVESTVVKYDGRWVVRTSVAHRDRSC